MTPVRRLSAWNIAVSLPSIADRLPHEARLCATVSDSELDELIDIYQSGSADERYEAMRVLTTLSRQKSDPRLLVEGRSRRWLSIVKQTVAAEYPRSALGMISLGILRERDRPASSQFLAAVPASRELSPTEVHVVVRDLLIDATSAAYAAIRRFAELDGDGGQIAKRALEQISPPSDETLETVARDWRATHRSEHLNRLWTLYISRVSYGSPAAKLFNLLGTPTSEDRRIFYYQAADSNACLILETDDQGKLVTWKLGE